MKAYIFAGDGTGKVHRSRHSRRPRRARAQEYRDKLVESVAESDESLMEKFFESGTLSDEELLVGPEKAGRGRQALSHRLHVGHRKHRDPAAV